MSTADDALNRRSPPIRARRSTRISRSSGLAARTPRVVPLTGDASDRRYFRDPAARRRRRSCWRCTPGRSTSTTLPFVNVARLLAADAGAGARRSSATPTSSASSRCRISATSRCRRTSARRRRRARGALPPGGRRSSRRCSGAARSWRPTATCPYGIAFDVEKLTWELEFFTKHFLEALPRRRDSAPPSATALARGVGGDRRRAGRRAARALPSRLPQPQPDAARRQPLHHRLPGRAHGARHLRSGVAAARLVRRPRRRRRSTS